MYNKNSPMPYLIKNKFISKNGIEFRYENNDNVGYLNIEILNLINETPVEDALVRVSSLTREGFYKENGIGRYFATYRTDSNGTIPLITLPVITNENEMYVLSVNADGYHSAYVLDIPIYPDITTSYKIYIKNISINSESDFEFILQPLIPGRYENNN